MADVLRSLRLGGRGNPAEACARALRAEGVALSLLVGDGRTPEPLWCHPGVSARFEELQFTLGEGPGPDAVRTGAPVSEPDLDRVRPDRWPALLPSARELGVHGVSCFPLSIGAIRIGVLTMLSDGDRRISEQQWTDATALAGALTGAFLNGDRRRSGGGSALAPGAFLAWPTGLHRAKVHQATGMISVQAGVSMADALLRLRAFAYSSERPLGEVADDVVARRLRFDDDMDDTSGPFSPDGGEG
ncbi:ANTAR domain-containing protein [Streptomyces sp. NBC_00038]|uniref:ANTAR domain-containing protein n=1 Tax=Streptomyces sp. NBC_00038 TaxID=2903615 RepID=UPI002251EBFB|nr:ANTAR domain-containing protein [Streptomyces sp. NBC_00038]MCX5559219.1 ANTAR domain-containing protein [Streptomyces sp. NBC_00038]